MTVLLLNVSYEPRGVITLKRAISLLHRGKVVPVGDTFEQVRTAHTVLNIPRVLRLIYYVNVPRTKARWSAKAMHKRDNHRCGFVAQRDWRRDCDRARGGDHVIFRWLSAPHF